MSTSFLRVFRAVVASAILSFASFAAAQTPPITPDIPAKYTPPDINADYVKRDVMIPMRDGVKLYTVIVVPKGAKDAPILLTRTPYNAAQRATRNDSRRSMLATAAAGRRGVRRATATSACSRTCAASTAPRATT